MPQKKPLTLESLPGRRIIDATHNLATGELVLTLSKGIMLCVPAPDVKLVREETVSKREDVEYRIGGTP